MGAANMLIDAASLGFFPWVGHILAVWLFGLALGWLLPRPKWTKRKNFIMLTPSGVWLGRATVVFNFFLLVREVWYRFCSPGTFRALVRALWTSITTRQPFQWPAALTTPSAADASGAFSPNNTAALADSLRWYVTTADLESFKDVVERGSGPAWEHMLHKRWEGCEYTAYRRTLPSGKTEYKSVTISENATAQEYMDFYLDDDTRPKWDGMITEHQLLEGAHEHGHRCQVVRWLRSFPFAFLSRREYVIARRVFAGDDASTLYGITKSVEHPAAPPLQGVVRMSSYYSMWRSRTVPCPNGAGRPVCETTLLHFEDFGIPENLARFAVRHGMAGFVNKMVPKVKEFVEARRERCDPFQPDAQTYGAGVIPLLLATPMPVVAQQEAAGERPVGSSSRLSRTASLGCMLLASGVAIAFSRSGSSAVLRSRAAAAAEEQQAPAAAGGASVPHYHHHRSVHGHRHAHGTQKRHSGGHVGQHAASGAHGGSRQHRAAGASKPRARFGLRSHRVVSHSEDA